MITKDHYLEWRNKRFFDYEVFYSFYLDNKLPHHKDLTFKEFMGYFAEFIEKPMIVGTDGAVKQINLKSIIKRCVEHFDRKFDVNL